jgi:hypothetical protein
MSSIVWCRVRVGDEKLPSLPPPEASRRIDDLREMSERFAGSEVFSTCSRLARRRRRIERPSSRLQRKLSVDPSELHTIKKMENVHRMIIIEK